MGCKQVSEFKIFHNLTNNLTHSYTTYPPKMLLHKVGMGYSVVSASSIAVILQRRMVVFICV